MAVKMKDGKSISLTFNSMACLLQSLLEKYTVVDLRNESSVYGKIVEVDGYMNVELEDCVFRNSQGKLYPFDSFYVKGRNIRFVHVPPGLSATTLIENFVNKPKRAPRKERTLKTSRAMKYQKELLYEIKTLK